MNVIIRQMVETDAPLISESFAKQGWNKPKEQYEKYYEEQTAGLRIVLVAIENQMFAGYLTVLWKSYYPPFADEGIPEIMDFNVLEKFRNRGIGSKLMDRAEAIISKDYPKVGISVGLYSNYGTAQRMYVKRGYIPDGLGVFYNENQIEAGAEVKVDDDLTLALTKDL